MNREPIPIETALRAGRAFLAAVRTRLRQGRYNEPIWIWDEPDDRGILPRQVLALLPPVRPNDPVAREEAELQAVLEFLLQIDFDWDGWANRCPAIEEKAPRIWQPFHPTRAWPCDSCSRLVSNGYLSLDKPLTYLCEDCYRRNLASQEGSA